MMPVQDIYGQLLEDNQKLIQRICRFYCHRHGLDDTESQDFCSIVQVKLIENDYHRLRQFKGKNLKSFLTTTIIHLLQDHKNKIWGKWRPSSKAESLGSVAIKLEAYIHRDKRSLNSAIEILRTNDGIKLDDKELIALYQQLPVRKERATLESPSMDALAHQTENPQQQLLDKETEDQLKSSGSVLTKCIERLDLDDRFIVKRIYWDNITVTRLAIILNEDRAVLYRRLDKIIRKLRKELKKEGLAKNELAKILSFLVI